MSIDSRRMHVERIETAHGGHIEPPCNENWDESTKLQWLAGVVHAATGLDVGVKASNFRINDIPHQGYYDVLMPGSGRGPCSFNTAWDVLNGIEMGYRAAKREGQEEPDRQQRR